MAAACPSEDPSAPARFALSPPPPPRSGEYQELAPPMLGIWNTLLKGEADATWIFTAWEGIEARRKGVELNTFR